MKFHNFWSLLEKSLVTPGKFTIGPWKTFRRPCMEMQENQNRMNVNKSSFKNSSSFLKFI